jgi:Sulfite oxidase and related enzymes
MEYFGGDEKTNKTSILIILLIISSTLVISTQTANAQPQWNLQITDLSGKTTTLTYDQVAAMPQTTVDSALYCYGSLVTQGTWVGVRLLDLLNQIGLDPSTTSITFLAQDNYKVEIPIETAKQPDVILAYQKDNLPLSEVYRLVVPYANGAVWISMVTSITLGTDVVASPQSQTASLTDALYNSRLQDTQPSTQPTPAPTTVQQIPQATPTQTPHNQITPAPTNQPPDKTDPSQSQTNTNTALYAVATAIVAAVAVASISVYRRKKT